MVLCVQHMYIKQLFLKTASLRVPARYFGSIFHISLPEQNGWHLADDIYLYFYEIKCFNRFKFHNLSLGVQLANGHHWFRHGSVPNGRKPLRDTLTGDPLHSRAACTQPCKVNTHSRAHCSPGARLCEQWGHGCVNNGARLCASARLCRGSPVTLLTDDPRRCAVSLGHKWINSSPPSAAYMSRSALFQIMACRLFGAKPLPEPMLTYCQLDPPPPPPPPPLERI